MQRLQVAHQNGLGCAGGARPGADDVPSTSQPSPEAALSDCIFCQIVAGSIPADVVAETPGVLAFHDINPVAPTHVLLIPKEHVADSIAEMTPEHGPLLAELFGLAARIAAEAGLDDGWKLVTNVGPAAGQTVFHAHFHLIGGWHRPLPTPDAESA